MIVTIDRTPSVQFGNLAVWSMFLAPAPTKTTRLYMKVDSSLKDENAIDIEARSRITFGSTVVVTPVMKITASA